MDPFKLLKEDHEKVSELFKRIESASGQAKLKLFKELKSELDLHAHIEETIFYPLLEKPRESHDITLEAYEEHKVVKDLLAQLAGAKKPSDEWEAKLTVLRENVEHHVNEEEGELFDKASDVLTGEQAEALGDQMAAEKKRQGKPVSPEKPGLLKTIVTALGIGESSAKKTGRSAKKSGKTAAVSRSKAPTRSAKATAQKRTDNGKRAGVKATTARGRKSSTSKAAGKSKAGARTKSRSAAAGR
jgi:iron-sulfur cluster repair protein YtfE (RIC family)